MKSAGQVRKPVFRKMILLVLIIGLSSGCSSRQYHLSPRNDNDDGSVPVIDDFGRSVQVGSVTRIVSLSPSCTEILFALGVQDRIVGLDEYSNYPAQAAGITKIGAYDAPSLEKILALQPDLVVADSIHKTVIHRLEEVEIPVVVANPQGLEGVLATIQWIAAATRSEDRAAALQADLSRRFAIIDEYVSKIPVGQRPWVYYELYSDPIMTCGPNTLSSQLIERAGGRNIAHDATTNYPEFSPESVVHRNPDIIIFPLNHGTDSISDINIRTRPGWDTIKAVQNGRLYGVDADIVSRYGPRVIQAVEEIAALLYPTFPDFTSPEQ